MTRTIVHLLRHGEVHNPDGILYGRLPGFRLSAAGEQMAAVVATWFTGHDVTGLYTSPLERARQTVAPLEALFGLDATVEPRVIESENDFEGTRFSVGDGALRDPKNWWRLRNPLRPSWGEPYAAIAERVLAAVYDARREQAGHEAIIVSHQLPVVCARRRAEGHRLWHRPDRRQCALASVTSFVFDAETLLRTEYAEPAASVSPTEKANVGA
ncbi:MAG TPA: histidine phosphatase family protein [Mycobacteriales bacterium]|jgi:broad specificity phosphatase PhoE|nr:histidine phosphatase family protein [Mycobacteriales bacterium]